jgi:serine/threonine-protein kinase OSR1/STK39
MEYMSGGSLADILVFAHPRGFEDEAIIATIVGQVLQFAAYIHERCQLHRALCTNNILLNHDGEVKVTDLGSATGLIRAGQRKRACFSVMDSGYAAPEGMEGRGYTEKSDIWSIGVVVIALATGRAPFDGMTQIEQIEAIVKGPTPELPPGEFSPVIRDFVHQCLQRDPEKRPAASVLLKHPFVKKARGRDFVARSVMASLPCLSQRFALMHRDVQIIGQERHAEHHKIAFDFAGDGGEVEKEPANVVDVIEPSKVAQIGRFHVIVQRRRSASEADPTHQWIGARE